MPALPYMRSTGNRQRSASARLVISPTDEREMWGWSEPNVREDILATTLGRLEASTEGDEQATSTKEFRPGRLWTIVSGILIVAGIIMAWLGAG